MDGMKKLPSERFMRFMQRIDRTHMNRKDELTVQPTVWEKGKQKKAVVPKDWRQLHLVYPIRNEAQANVWGNNLPTQRNFIDKK